MGIPINCISNFKLGSTSVFALCILKLSCHPLFKYISTVLVLFDLNLIATNSVGKITEGMEAADKIVGQNRDFRDKPKTPQVMKKVTIEEE